MSSWWRKIARRWAHLSALNDAKLVVYVVCFAALVPLLLHLKLVRLQRLLAPFPISQTPKPGQAAHIVKVVDTVLQAGRPWLRTECLTRGLTLYYFLNRADWDVGLRFGLGQIEGTFAGHCWLVRNEHPVFEMQDPTARFTVMYHFPGGGGTGHSPHSATPPTHV